MFKRRRQEEQEENWPEDEVDPRQQTAEEYTRQMKSMTLEAIVILRTVSARMKRAGDDTRAMDIDEAITYADGAIEEWET
jgi:hypothetical protein